MKKLTNTISYLFVYGTLRKQYQLDLLNKIAENIQFFDHGFIRGCLYDLGDYPGAVKSEMASVIKGDVLLVKNEKTLAVLDDYEGYYPDEEHASLFIRAPEKVELNNGTCIGAWVYWYNKSINNKTRIPEGDYLAYIKK